MSDLVLMPNVESMLTAYLQSQADIVALIGERSYTELPHNVVFPAIRVTQYNDLKVTVRPLWVVTAYVQLDAFGGTKNQAWTLASTAQSAIAAMEGLVLPGGVVSAANVGGMSDQPDTDYEPAKPRFRVDFSITVHPVPDTPAP